MMSEFEPLPWFAFNIEKWMADTKRLNTEGQGAYLALCLEIYQKGDPLPDDNEMLAAIAGLDLAAWNKQRKFLAGFFTIENGLWRHGRCEREMREAAELVAKRKASSEHANAAKAAKTGPVTAPVTDRSVTKKTQRTAPATVRATGPVTAPVTVTVIATATEPAKITDPAPVPVTASDAAPATGPVTASVSATVSDSEPHLQETRNTLKGGERAQVREEPPPPEGETDLEGKDRKDSAAIMTELSASWQPSETNIEVAHDYGLTDMEIDDQARAFVNNALSKGLMSRNWNASWAVWCQRERDFKAKQPPKAAPRVELNTAIDWDRHAAFFAKTGIWSKGIGNEPGMLGCKCPPEVLLKHGINPETGIKARAAS